MQTVYIETSIVSYLCARPSAHVVAAARQLLTRRWWDLHRGNYDLVTSQFVLDEAGKGNAALAAARLEVLSDIPLLDIPDEIPSLADGLLGAAILPEKARLDALQICTASFHGVEFLLTWNCAHIANARLLPRIRQFIAGRGYVLPEVSTPEEMLDDNYPIR
jgi:hypothetical protein